jgi:hypothetical protein
MQLGLQKKVVLRQLHDRSFLESLHNSSGYHELNKFTQLILDLCILGMAIIPSGYKVRFVFWIIYACTAL